MDPQRQEAWMQELYLHIQASFKSVSARLPQIAQKEEAVCNQVRKAILGRPLREIEDISTDYNALYPEGPKDLALIGVEVGSVIACLQSILDYTIRFCAYANNEEPGARSSFPITEEQVPIEEAPQRPLNDQEKYKAQMEAFRKKWAAHLKGLSPAQITTVFSLQPAYVQWGPYVERLSAIHFYRNVTLHNNLSPVDVYLDPVHKTIRYWGSPEGNSIRITRPDPDPYIANVGVVLRPYDDNMDNKPLMQRARLTEHDPRTSQFLAPHELLRDYKQTVITVLQMLTRDYTGWDFPS